MIYAFITCSSHVNRDDERLWYRCLARVDHRSSRRNFSSITLGLPLGQQTASVYPVCCVLDLDCLHQREVVDNWLNQFSRWSPQRYTLKCIHPKTLSILNQIKRRTGSTGAYSLSGWTSAETITVNPSLKLWSRISAKTVGITETEV